MTVDRVEVRVEGTLIVSVVDRVESEVDVEVTENVVGEVIVVVDTVDVEIEADVTVEVIGDVTVVSNVEVIGVLTVDV